MTVSDPTTRKTYQEGVAAGAADNLRVSSCPPVPPRGENRPRGYPNGTYYLGYDATFRAVPHRCTAECNPEG